MKLPGYAALRIAGVIWIGLALSALAQRYAVPIWEKANDEKLAEVFQKLTGQAAWKVRGVDHFYGLKAGDSPVPATGSAWVLGPPKQETPRVSRGAVRYLWKKAIGEKSAWLPGEPFQWAEITDGPEEFRSPKEYVIVAPPKDSLAKANRDLAERIYDRPIFLKEPVSAKECEVLLDALFSRLAAARNQTGDSMSFCLDQHGNPHFAEVASIGTKNPYSPMPTDSRGELRYIELSQGGDGVQILLFELQNGRAMYVNAVDVSF